MDPISQATVGAALAVAASRKPETRAACLAGALGGLAPDIDVFLGSATDPLLFLEFHRQMTHSLAFIPVGGLMCAGICYFFLRRRVSYWRLALYATLGYATHGLLDSCTSYGTQLFWPFTDYRVSWNNMSIIDPIMTLTLLALLVTATARRSAILARVAFAWVLAYVGFGTVQNLRVTATAEALVADRGHAPIRLEPKPSFGNVLLWKVIYEYDGRYYVDAVRAGFKPRIYPGTSVEKLSLAAHFPWLDAASQQARDVKRFRWFSQDFLAWDPEANWIVDMRYSNLPNQIDGLWGIRLHPDAGPSTHAEYITRRGIEPEQSARYLAMLWGDSLLPGQPPPPPTEASERKDPITPGNP